jgi:hypothetical protein
MKPAARKRIALLLVFLLSLPFAVYWLLNAWLESSGGRQMLEQELSGRIGMSVRLAGDFDLMLLPQVGVSGTRLLIGGAADSPDLFALFGEFEISVRLKPLFQRQVVVEWIRLTGGRVYPERYRPAVSAVDPVATRLPEIRELALRDFEIVLPGDQEPLRLTSLEITDFAEQRQTAFALEVESLATAVGWLLWDTERSGIRFGDLELSVGRQSLGGAGCLLLGEPWSVRVDLQAVSIDADAVLETLPVSGAEGGQGGLPVDIRARLRVGEIRSGGVVAEGVELAVGEEPDCSALD